MEHQIQPVLPLEACILSQTGKTIGKLKIPTERVVKFQRGEMICMGMFDFLSICMFIARSQKD